VPTKELPKPIEIFATIVTQKSLLANSETMTLLETIG